MQIVSVCTVRKPPLPGSEPYRIRGRRNRSSSGDSLRNRLLLEAGETDMKSVPAECSFEKIPTELFFLTLNGNHCGTVHERVRRPADWIERLST